MGVHGLWKLLESTGKPINPETLEGKILAVDISIWLNQAVKGVRDRQGNSVQNAHLLTLFNRLCKLLFFRIRPVFVFDGEAPLLKRQTLANRRQRKEEMSVESKQTHEKLLRTFLKRQAIKAALGNKSQEMLPSISSVRREEVDDIYVLPPLEKQRISPVEEEENEWEEMPQNRHRFQEEMHENFNSVDIDSEEFALLPAEMKHEILKDMKEFSKRRRTMFQKPPERSRDFSQYQLEGLLRRNQLNQRLEGVEREMAQRGVGMLEVEEGHSVETRPLMSEDSTHYILIKGPKDSQKAPVKQPAVLPWSGLPKVGRGRPEPLWRPLSETSPERKPSSPPRVVPSPPMDQAGAPPSPRTLRAIQAAMMGSSSEEEGEVSVVPTGRPRRSAEGELSPRTLRAVQCALAEEKSGHPAAAPLRSPPPVLVESISISSSDGEMDGSTVERHRAGSLPPHTAAVTGGCSGKAGPTPPDSESSRSSTPRLEGEPKSKLELENGAEQESGPLSSQHSRGVEKETDDWPKSLPLSSIQLSPPIGQEVTSATGKASDDSQQKSALGPSGREGVPESTGENVEEVSDSEESFIEVSGGEEEEEEEEEEELRTGDSTIEEMVEVPEEEKGSFTEISVEGTSSPEVVEQAEGKTPQPEETPADSAASEWEHMDLEELVQLESSLQAQQSSLQAQKQQQERIATTVTGQMCLESQELLRLFGVPYLVAPMEAEAQCAALDRADQTHGTITEDSDVWLFGGRHVYKNFFSQNKYVEQYQFVDIQNQLGLDQTKLINLAYLLGSDYTEGIPGVGYVTGMEILNEFPGPGLEPLTSFCKWWTEAQDSKKLVPNPNDSKVKKKLRNAQLPPGFPNPSVAQAYLWPTVDDSGSAFTWGQPSPELIKDFCLSRFGWSSRKTDEVLQPVLKKLHAQQTQLRIDSFFRLEQRERQAVRSQRLRRAITCLKRKESELEEDVQEQEEESRSPAKARKGKATPDKAAEMEAPAAWGVGGFLDLQGASFSQDGGEEEEEEEEEKDVGAPGLTQAPRPQSGAPRTGDGSDSSGGDSDANDKVTMVTARSVFKDKVAGRGRRGGRGKSGRRR